MSAEYLPATALPAALVGGFHGLNPSMGWLFAVFLALQRKSRRVLLTALLPIALGHAVSVAVVALVVFFAQSTLPVQPVRLATAALLLAFGVYKLLTISRHIRWVGLNVGHRELAWWSFLVATAHGSGLMLAPLVLGQPGAASTVGLLAIHSLTMMVVMAGMAMLVYVKLGVATLRSIWINFDLLWLMGLFLAGGLALVGLLVAPAH